MCNVRTMEGQRLVPKTAEDHLLNPTLLKDLQDLMLSKLIVDISTGQLASQKTKQHELPCNCVPEMRTGKTPYSPVSDLVI